MDERPEANRYVTSAKWEPNIGPLWDHSESKISGEGGQSRLTFVFGKFDSHCLFFSLCVG